MINPQQWVPAALDKLTAAFGPRLLYLGLQGSYRRGEATETSDIDLVTLLDTVSLDDLDTYRAVVHSLPEGEKACGFLADAATFALWPRHELFPFKMDTRDCHGALDDFLPPVSREDIRDNVRIGASGLLHVLTHTYLYAPPDARPAVLKDCCKSAYFVMQVAHYLATDIYCTSKKMLLERVDGEEKEIIAAGMDFPAWLAAHDEKRGFTLLLTWCKAVLERFRQ